MTGNGYQLPWQEKAPDSFGAMFTTCHTQLAARQAVKMRAILKPLICKKVRQYVHCQLILLHLTPATLFCLHAQGRMHQSSPDMLAVPGHAINLAAYTLCPAQAAEPLPGSVQLGGDVESRALPSAVPSSMNTAGVSADASAVRLLPGYEPRRGAPLQQHMQLQWVTVRAI